MINIYRTNKVLGLIVAVTVITLVGVIAAVIWGSISVSRDNASSPTATPPIPRDLAPDAVTDPAFPSLTYGVHAFLWWNEAIRTYDLDNIRLMQFSHVKQRFAWHDVQPEADTWHWGKADGVIDEVSYRGLELVARLDGPPEWALKNDGGGSSNGDIPLDLDAWGAYCGAVAERYQGRIAAYQVWNEPNLRREWFDLPPDAAGYVRLLRVCADAIRAADPNAVVISAGLAPTGTQPPEAIPDTDYLRQMYAAGASDAFDVLGLHAPGYGAEPEMSPDEAAAERGHRWMCFRHVEDMRGIMVAAGDAQKQVALLEVGWTTDTREGSDYAWHAVKRDTQADYLVRAYQWAAEQWRPWVGLVITIYIADLEWDENDEEWWWALNDGGYGGDWGGRPAYYALSNMARWIDDEFIPARNPGDPAATTVDPLPPREGEE